jgi:hypothetical protein
MTLDAFRSPLRKKMRLGQTIRERRIFDAHAFFTILKIFDAGPITNCVRTKAVSRQSNTDRTTCFLQRVTPHRFPCNMTPMFGGWIFRLAAVIRGGPGLSCKKRSRIFAIIGGSVHSWRRLQWALQIFAAWQTD